MLVCGARARFLSFLFLALISFSTLSIDLVFNFFSKIFLPIPVKSKGVFFFNFFFFSK